MHLTVTRVHGILPIKHLEEWLAYGKCSVNISTLHLNYSRCPFATPTGPPSPTQPGLSFTMFSFHHSQFGLTALPPSLGPIQLHLLPLGGPFFFGPSTSPSCSSFNDILRPGSSQRPQLRLLTSNPSYTALPLYEILSMTFSSQNSQSFSTV